MQLLFSEEIAELLTTQQPLKLEKKIIIDLDLVIFYVGLTKFKFKSNFIKQN